MNANDIIIFKILKSADKAGRPGMYRADIFAQPEAELIESVQYVSRSLHTLLQMDLITKGARNGVSGSLWSYLRDPENANLDEDADTKASPNRANLGMLTADGNRKALSEELDQLCLRLGQTHCTIQSPTIKTHTLERLAEITAAPIADVLLDIVEDIRRIGKI